MTSNWIGFELVKFKSAQYLSVPISRQLILNVFETLEELYTAQSLFGERGCFERLFKSSSRRVFEIDFKFA